MPVDIHDYAGGSTLKRTFKATGSYSPGGPADTLPTVILEDTDGTVIATGATAHDSIGFWKSDFALGSDYDDLSLLATLGGDDSDEPHINIRETVPVTINPLPPPPPPPPPGGGGGSGGGTGAVAGGAGALAAPVPWPPFDVTGTHGANVAAIVVVAFSYKPNNRVDSILASVPALLDTPAPAQWKATLTINMPTNRRLVVRAVAVNRRGKFLAAVANRGKKS